MPTSMTPEAREALATLQRLEQARKDRNARTAVYSDYYDGEHTLAFASELFEEAFGGRLKEFADNWCQVVVDASSERMRVEGFRYGEDTEGDELAWEIWNANELDADSELAHTEALIQEEAFALVWPDAAGGRIPTVTVEDPQQVYVEMVPGSRRVRRAAIKVWTDGEETHANLYTPTQLWKFAARSNSGKLWMPSGVGEWWPRQDPEDPTWPLRNPLGRVPIVPLQNVGRIGDGGQSDLRRVIPIQNAVNKLLADLLIASEYGSFRQRWVTGLQLIDNPDDDEAMEPFRAAVDRLLVAEDPGARFGEFSETDLTNLVAAIEMLVQHIASQTRTPPHYFYLSGQFPSGESIKSAETGLVAKVKRKFRHMGGGWSEVMSLSMLAAGDTTRARARAEVIWADPESRSEAEHTDALLKQKSLGIPNEILWEKAGYTPEEIARIKSIWRKKGQPEDGSLPEDATSEPSQVSPAPGVSADGDA